MTATQKPLALDAWGGTVRDGDECWVIDEVDYTMRRVESARLIELNYTAHLLHENKIIRFINVAKTEADALKRLEESARGILNLRNKRCEAARRFLASLS